MPHGLMGTRQEGPVDSATRADKSDGSIDWGTVSLQQTRGNMLSDARA